MLKKILNAIVFLVILTVLVAGGIIRTQSVIGAEEITTVVTTGVADAGIVETTSSDWVTQEGVVQSWQDEILTVLADTGEMILIEGRGGRYLAENAFSATAGERLSLTGFYDGDVFEVATITNQATGISIRLRGDDGRPVWGSGGGGQ